MAGDAGEIKARATLDNTEFLGALKEMVQGIQTNSQSAADKIDGMTDGFAKLGEAVAGFAAGSKIVEFAADCVDAAAQLNKLHAGFVAINGASEETEQTFEAIENLGLHSMFDFADTLGPAAKQMMLLGMSAEDTTSLMTGLVDAASALKQGPDWINGVTGAIDNMEAHLVASSRDMKALSQQGIDAWGDLATSLGVSISDAQKMVKDGTVTATQVAEAVADDLKTRFADAASLTGNTWMGAMHTLSAEGEKAEAAIGNSILAVLNDFAPVLNNIAALIETLTTYWQSLSEPVQDAVLAFGAALVVVTAITVALPLLEAGFAAIATTVGTVSLPVVAAVAALALIGKWVYDEWPAIQAVFLALWDNIATDWSTKWGAITAWWDGIAAWFTGIIDALTPVVNFLLDLFSPILALWTAEWNGIKSLLEPIWTWILEQAAAIEADFNKLIGALASFVSAIPGDSQFKKLADAWQQGQAAIQATADATAAHTKAIKDNTDATSASIQARKQQDQVDLAKANSDKVAAAAAKQAAADAKQAAQEQEQYNASLKKSYDILNAVAPDTAQAFADMYGGMGDDATNAAKIIGAAWDDLDTATQTAIQSAITLEAAYKTLGETNSTALQNSADKAEDAYTTISDSGTATAGDLAKAFDAVVAANQRVIDQNNTDLKDSYAAGKITATDYYDTVTQRAEDSLAAAKQAYEDGFATEEDVAAKEKILLADRTTAFQQQQTDYTAAMTAIGAKTEEQLSDATAQWQKYADNIGQRLGVDSKQYIDANIKLVQSMIDQNAAMGKKPDDSLTSWLQILQAQLTNMATPAEQFAADMKKLGVNTTQDAVKGIDDMAAALANAKDKSDGTLQSQADLKAGEDALEQQVRKLVDTYNTQWKVALENGDITQTQYLQHMKDGAQGVVQQFQAMGDDSPGQIEKVQAAQALFVIATGNFVKGEMADMNKAWDDLGVKSPAATKKMSDAAVRDFGIVSSTANTQGTAYMNAWINAHTAIYKALTDEGTSLSSGQKDDLGKMTAARDEWLESNKSAWTTSYTTIKTDVGNAFDALTEQIVTGDLSFGKLFTKLWQDLADAALNAFLAPLKQAITNFISHELADLLGDQGLGGVLSKLKQIGQLAPQISGGSGVSVPGVGSGEAPQGGGLPGGSSGDFGGETGGGDIGSGEGGIEGGGLPGGDAGDFGGEASSGVGGAASSIAASSIAGVVGVVSGVVSAISGIIGNFQMAKQETTLNAIEHNTRYTMMYVGDRADGGILGEMFRLREEVTFGHITVAIESLRNMFLDWHTPMLEAGQNTQHILESFGPYIADSKDALFAIKDSVNGLKDTIAGGFQGLTVTVNASGLTTSSAARELGNQIATNLSRQLVQTS